MPSRKRPCRRASSSALRPRQPPGIRQEASRDGAAGFGPPEPPGHVSGEALDRGGQGGFPRDRPDQGVVRVVERAVESLADGSALLGEEAPEAVLPGDPVGVERPAEIQEHGAHGQGRASPLASPATRCCPRSARARHDRARMTASPGSSQTISRARRMSP